MEYEVGVRLDTLMMRIDVIDKKLDFIVEKFQKAEAAEMASAIEPGKPLARKMSN